MENTKETLTYKEELTHDFVCWEPEVVFAEALDCQLIMVVDPFNNRITWEVSKGQAARYVYDDFTQARDFFLNQTHYNINE